MKRSIYIKAEKLLKEIVEKWEFGDKVYYVGGCVRDLQLGNIPKDIDLCIDVDNGTDKFIEYLRNYQSDLCHGFTVFPKYGTAKFSLKVFQEDIDIECVIPRTESYNDGPRKPDSIKQTTIEEDAKRRDFCCNALYKNILTGEVLDPTGKGLVDCTNKILRTPLDPYSTYIDDPLRMMRAIRFSCTKGFVIEESTRKAIFYYPQFDQISVERIRDEFDKILMSQCPIKGLDILIETELMIRIIKRFVKYKDFDQNSRYHNLTWKDHTFSVLDKVVSQGANLETRLAALLHDIAKPTCYQVKSDGTYSFHEHDIKSADIAKSILTSLKYSNDIIDKVCFLVRNHMCIKQFYDYSLKTYTGKPKVTRKLIRLLGDNMTDEMMLIDADNLSHSPRWNMPGQVSSFLNEVARIKELGTSNNNNFSIPITGEDIMNHYHISPGVLVKEIKKILQEYYDDNPNLSKDELLLEYDKEFLKKNLWIIKTDYRYSVFILEPKITDSDISFDCRDTPLDITEGELLSFGIERRYIPEKENTYTKVSAIYAPRLYRRKSKHFKFYTTSVEIAKLLESLETDCGGYKSFNCSLEMNDLSFRVEWEDGTIDSVL